MSFLGEFECDKLDKSTKIRADELKVEDFYMLVRTFNVF